MEELVPEPHCQQQGDTCSGGGGAAPDIATLVQARLVFHRALVDCCASGCVAAVRQLWG